MTRDERIVRKALAQIPTTEFQRVAAILLVRINGLDNALEYIEQIKRTNGPAIGEQLRMELDD